MNILAISPSCPKEMEESTKAARCFSEAFVTVRPLSYHSECLVSVCKCKSIQDSVVVVKKYMRDKLSTTAQLQVKTEIQIHSTLSDSSVVRMLVAFEDSRHVYIVIEHAEKGDLRGHMNDMTEQRVRDFMALPILKALVMLHEENIVHRDLKPDNILVGKDNQVMLADFGLSMYCNARNYTPQRGGCNLSGEALRPGHAPLSDEAALRATLCSPLTETAAGTPLYTAPEVLLCMFKNKPMQQAVQPKNDVWSLGVMLLEALTGSHPFTCGGGPNARSNNLMYTIAHLTSVALPRHLSLELTDFLSQALRTDPEQRPSSAELLQHPWLTCIEPRLGAKVFTTSSKSSTAMSTPILSGRTSSSGDCSGPTCCGRAAESEVNSQSHTLGNRRALSFFEVLDCWES